MSKRKQIQRGLLNNSAAAYYAAIELHNKPNVSYRYETTTLLMLNAWELLLKAYVRKYTTCDIFLKDGRTITFGKALEETLRSMEGKEFKAFKPVSENLYLLERYRNEFAHFYRDDMDAAVFSLLAKSSLNYIEFRKRYFPSYRFVDEGLYILPLGFSLPFQPELLFSGGKQVGSFSPETKKFLEMIAKVTTGLEGAGIEDSVVVGFDIHLSSVKSVANADIIAKLEEGGAPVSVQKRVRITDFQSIFDEVDLCGGDARLIFYYRKHDGKDPRVEVSKAVAHLLTEYGRTMDNEDHGRNLMHKLLLEGRLSVLELGRQEPITPGA